MKKFLLLLALCASFSMMAQEAEVIKGILPSGLTSSVDGGNATFKFYSNSAAESAQLIFSDATTGEEVGTYDLTGVVEGNNEFVIPIADLPGDNGQVLNWAVKLEGKPITDYTLINNLDDFNYSYTFSTVDNNPESDFFGRIYVGHRPGTGDPNNGLWIYNPDYTKVNETVINSRSDGLSFRSNYRLGIDPTGKVYMPEWGDAPSGVFVFDPANPDAGFKEFFSNPDGTSLNRDGDGMLTNAYGEVVGGSCTNVAFAGEGENLKMYVYNEDVIINGKGNNVSVYNIGNATSWNQAPDVNYAVGAYEVNGNGNLYPDEERGGVWIAQYRSTGQNTSSVPSLLYVNAEGEILYNSGDQADILNGSMGSGFTLTPDGSQLVISDGNTNISFYNIIWGENGAPSLEYVTQFTPAAGIARSGLIYQLHFDYAGNLIMSGAKVGIYSIPTDENITIVPAKKALTITKVVEEPTFEEMYVVGTFNGWSQEEGMVELVADDDNYSHVGTVELEAGAEFKIITPEGEGWKWFGGIDENNVGYFLINDEIINDGINEIYLLGDANFKVENAGNYTITVYVDYTTKEESLGGYYILRMNIIKNDPEAITTINSDKVDNAWYNMSGIRFETMPAAPGIYIHNGKKVIIK
ncbi:MAG: SusF/SusE family outer membrane protein [Muribaculaceae bacterium]|nr:SusF/SusE family outer membrane protein [Muribaculaceae bacterium]